MALQTSGAISLNDIQTEFGGSNPIAISEYYGAAAGIPSSGTISIADFYGASAVIPPTTVTVTEGRAFWTQTIYKAAYSYYLQGYFANADETAGDQSWNVNSAGSRSPTTFNGVTIEALAYYNNTFVPLPTFYFVLQGNRPQNFFTSIKPQGSELELASSTAASYTYDATGNYTKWSWANINNSPFGANNTMETQWDGTGTSTVVITP